MKIVSKMLQNIAVTSEDTGSKSLQGLKISSLQTLEREMSAAFIYLFYLFTLNIATEG